MSPVQASEILLPDTDLDVLFQITVPAAAATGDVVVVTDPGGGAPRRFDTVPPATVVGGPYIPLSQKGAPSGVAELDAGGKIPVSQIPLIAINDVFDAASQAAMLALTAQTGDMARRTDLSNQLYVLAGTGDPTVLSNWIQVAAGVVSGGASRTKTTITTGVLAPSGQTTGSFSLSKASVLVRAVALLGNQCRIRLYGTSAARDADVARAVNTQAIAGSPSTGTGCAADLALSSAEGYAINLDPKAVLANQADPPVVTMYYTIDNLTAGSVPVILDLYHTPIES